MTRTVGPAKASFAVACTILFVYFLPFVLEWDSSIVTVHDNLDGPFNYYITLALEGKTFALNPDAKIESIMHGLPRMFFPSGFNVLAILCVVFPPYVAFLLNFILVHSIAFVGMFLVLRKHVLQSEEDLTIIIFTALAFSLIPFYTVIGLSVAGLPLVLYSILNFHKKCANWKDYAICALFPFYSFFVLSGLFILICTAIFFLWDYFAKRNWMLLKPLLVLTVGYILVEYQMFWQLVFRRDIITH
jgi:hypothetical protein